MARLLSDDEVDRAVGGTGWRRQERAIVRTVDRGDFAGSVAYLNRVTEVAEEMNHHPDVSISWSKVTLSITTHSAGGLTQSDLELARRIDALE